MPQSGIFRLKFLKKLLSYFKSAHSNLSNCKILQKNKMPKFETKNALFRYFWGEFGNDIVIFQIRALEYVKLQNFTK